MWPPRPQPLGLILFGVILFTLVLLNGLIFHRLEISNPLLYYTGGFLMSMGSILWGIGIYRQEKKDKKEKKDAMPRD